MVGAGLEGWGGKLGRPESCKVATGCGIMVGAEKEQVRHPPGVGGSGELEPGSWWPERKHRRLRLLGQTEEGWRPGTPGWEVEFGSRLVSLGKEGTGVQNSGVQEWAQGCCHYVP